MPSVRVSFVGPIRRPLVADGSVEVDLPEGATVDDLLVRLGYGSEERAWLRVLCGSQPLRRWERVAAGCELTIFLPVGGG